MFIDHVLVKGDVFACVGKARIGKGFEQRPTRTGGSETTVDASLGFCEAIEAETPKGGFHSKEGFRGGNLDLIGLNGSLLGLDGVHAKLYLKMPCEIPAIKGDVDGLGSQCPNIIVTSCRVRKEGVPGWKALLKGLLKRVDAKFVENTVHVHHQDVVKGGIGGVGVNVVEELIAYESQSHRANTDGIRLRIHGQDVDTEVLLGRLKIAKDLFS